VSEKGIPRLITNIEQQKKHGGRGEAVQKQLGKRGRRVDLVKETE